MHNSLVPNLMVESVSQTAHFYCDVLGFKFIAGIRRFEDEDSPSNIVTKLDGEQSMDWANVKINPQDPGSAELMFQSRRSLSEDVPSLAGVTIGASQTLYFQMSDLNEHYARLAPVVDVVQPPVNKFYGMREWYLRDPDGYILCFGEQCAV